MNPPSQKTLPPDAMIYPAHYSSDAERQEDRTVGGGFEAVCQSNEPLQMQTEEEFTEWVKSRVSSFPGAYRKMKVINVGLLAVSPEEADELEAGRRSARSGEEGRQEAYRPPSACLFPPSSPPRPVQVLSRQTSSQ